jgi:radical SAM enzyme (TIGR01210 family)
MDRNHAVTSAAIRRLRPTHPRHEAGVPQGFLIEEEPTGTGGTVTSATYFLTGSECRFTCSFCDLWKHTLAGETPPGSLVRQLEALHRSVADQGIEARWLKLYNASNFFDPKNVPDPDLDALALGCAGFERVVVENHAALLRSKACQNRIERFADRLAGRLEVALGLESIDPAAMRWMNKSMSLGEFDAAVEWLRMHSIAIRAFVLLQPPGTDPEASVEWTQRTCDYAFARGVERCSLIPTRAGNGWMDALAARGEWTPPTVLQLEAALRAVLEAGCGSARIATADVWDWPSLSGGCDNCRRSRYDRVMRMNRLQRASAEEFCPGCEGTET